MSRESASDVRDRIECNVNELIFWVIEFATSRKLVVGAKHSMAPNRDIFLWATQRKYYDGNGAALSPRATRISSD